MAFHENHRILYPWISYQLDPSVSLSSTLLLVHSTYDYQPY